MPKFSDLDLNAMNARLDKNHDDFIADMKQKRVNHQKQISALTNKMDAILAELKEFDKETKGAFQKS